MCSTFSHNIFSTQQSLSLFRFKPVDLGLVAHLLEVEGGTRHVFVTALLLVRPRHGALIPSRGGQPIRETGRSGSNTIPTSVKPVQGEYAQVPHISSLFGGDPLVITPWLTNHNRDLETSLGLVNPRGGRPVKGLILCKPDLDH